MSIAVTAIEVRIVDHPLRHDRVIVSPIGVHDRSRFVLVTAVDGQGTCGHGEAATTAMWSGETADSAQSIIQSLLAPLLVDCTFDHPRDALARMDKHLVGNPFAKSAVETALWDLWARQQNVPAVELFADRTLLASLPTRASVGTYPVEQTLQIAGQFLEVGVRTLKFKIGTPGVDDVARLRAARQRFGDGVIFTVDANGAYPTADAALRAIEQLLPYRLALIEQPTLRDRLTALADVRRKLDVPVMADESVFTPDDLAEALDLDAFDILSVYPGKNGGLAHSIDMAQSAQRAGKTCAIGSNLETDLGQAAMAALAAGLSAFPTAAAGDYQAALFYERSSSRPPLAFEHGSITVPSGIGFGVKPATRES